MTGGNGIVAGYPGRLWVRLRAGGLWVWMWLDGERRIIFVCMVG